MEWPTELIQISALALTSQNTAICLDFCRMWRPVQRNKPIAQELEVKTDMQLKKDVLAELEWDPSINAARIGVEVDGGVVTLSGHVGSYPAKLAAERAAQRVSGVKAVALEIEVDLPGMSRRTDADIAGAVADTLSWNALVPEDRIHVRVEDGTVTLSGDVEWSFQRSAAESSVRNLMGVKAVVNSLRIVSPLSTNDLRTKIEAALQRAAHFDARDISILVDGNKVTLKGSVHSLAQRRLVENAVWAAPGVHELVDYLAIDD